MEKEIHHYLCTMPQRMLQGKCQSAFNALLPPPNRILFWTDINGYHFFKLSICFHEFFFFLNWIPLTFRVCPLDCQVSAVAIGLFNLLTHCKILFSLSDTNNVQ